MIDSILADIANDATPEAGRLAADLVARYLADSSSGTGHVTPSRSADALYALIDGPLPEEGRPFEAVLARLHDEVLANAIRLSHPMYLGHQVSAPLPVAVWTEPVISALNNSLAVQEMSPVGTAIETRVIRWLAELVELGPAAGGTFTSGGTEATFTALLAARAAALPGAWEHGVGANPPMVVCGEHAHYAVTRAVAELGLGLTAAVPVASSDHRMDPSALRATLDRLAGEGRRVMAVVATAGSTATGSYDDLDQIGELCQAHGVWLHVDAAHGGSAVFSPTHRSLVRGLRHARSVAWDAHKMMLLPLSAGMLLVRNEDDLTRAFSQQAPYLFHEEAARHWDLGTRSFACSRRFDALKVWAVLQRHGTRALGRLFDHLSDLAVHLHAAVLARHDFEALHAPDCNILCFRWLPDGVTTPALVDQLNRQLRQQYNRSGAGWITLTVLDGRPVLRVTIMNPRTTTADVDRLLDGLAVAGARLLAGHAR